MTSQDVAFFFDPKIEPSSSHMLFTPIILNDKQILETDMIPAKNDATHFSEICGQGVVEDCGIEMEGRLKAELPAC